MKAAPCLPTTLQADESNGGLGNQITFTRVIVMPDGFPIRTLATKRAGMWREKVDQHNTGTGTVSTVWSVSWDEEVEQSDG